MRIPLDKTGKEQTLRSSATSTPFLADRPSLDDQRLAGQPKGHFIYRHGQRHHSFDNEKAPYPLSYTKDLLEIEAIDNEFIHFLKSTASPLHLEEQPSRVLDLGCGIGTWIVHAAKEWPSCTLIGFDLVNVQIPIEVLDPSIRNRVEWRHGNFLTTRLPFEDDEFDHIHIQFVAKGVPENKWNYVFDVEVNRVLRPGGSIEIIEEDIIFPLMPRWFTDALRDRNPQENSVNLSDWPSLSIPFASQKVIPHDHALLESLLASVFEERFINIKPTALLPGYFTSYFRQVVVGPAIHFPMPPLGPLQPLPAQIFSNMVDNSLAPPPTIETSTFDSSQRPYCLPSRDTSDNTLISRVPERLCSLSNGPISLNTDGLDPQLPPRHVYRDTAPFKKFIIGDENEQVEWPRSLIPLDRLRALSERSLAMQLYRSYQTVFACQEAMWDELIFRLSNRKEELFLFGWKAQELEALQARQKFEKLMEQFRSDVKARLAMWSSLIECGFTLPRPEPLSKEEYMKELQRRECLFEACKQATIEEAQQPCRTLRILIGYK